MVLEIKQIYFILKEFKTEIIASLLSILVTWTSFSYSSDKFIALAITVGVLIVSLLALVYLRTKENRHTFYYLPFTKLREKDEWVGKGTWEYSKSNNAYTITDSPNGFIFPKCLLWQDYIMSFDFKIVKNCSGWIIRARNLSNYIMLQCGLDGINPHVKLNGIWKLESHKDVNLTFDEELRLDMWYRARIYCEKSQIKIQIYDQERKSIFDRMWEIPENLLLHYSERIDNKEGTKPIALPVDLDFGTIGFRCCDPEKSLIRDLLVQKI